MIGRRADHRHRFVRFVAVLAIVAAGVYAVPTLWGLGSSIAVFVLGAIAIATVVGAAVQAFYNDGVLLGGAAVLALSTAVFLTGEVITTLRPTYDDSHALPMYVTLAAISIAVGIAASALGITVRRLVS